MIAFAAFLFICIVGLFVLGLVGALVGEADERTRQRAANRPPPPRKKPELPEHLLPYSLIAKRLKA
jgi:hypothetical protein